ncbi:putative LRR receptor-like serine/threonine-protein kinase [Sesamum angolense]|uniref:non-specific serine/threonine protein kinase n=1 Tax=Sesamum angolense TaxID=2727404 RepID=A0AAE1WU00_9LAMI|nr:putative LRR receptor-like serine/threonine-protein kinase [Sesamum angolense]
METIEKLVEQVSGKREQDRTFSSKTETTKTVDAGIFRYVQLASSTIVLLKILRLSKFSTIMKNRVRSFLANERKMEQMSLNITTDQSALLVFKSQFEHETGNVLARNWSSDTPVCSWTGITCSSRHLRVAAINVSNMDVSGIIPPQLGNLSFLVSLDLSGNKFHGDLPEELAKLKRLRFISFSFNRFSGKIPSWFGALPNLQELLLENCSFTGSIPPSLSNISKLETLNLKSNSLEGMIPMEIGNLHNLKVLQLRENQLSGSIPASIFNISTLEKADFTINDLSGNLPGNLCRHVSHLKYFSVYSNQLYGQIPSTIDQCSQLQTLLLQFNQFTGPVPKQIGNLSMLVDFILEIITTKVFSLPPFLSRKHFTVSYLVSTGTRRMTHPVFLEICAGEIPAEIGNLPNLEYLTLDAVGLKGPIPSFIYNISTLQWLYLGQNNLTGNLPDMLAPSCSTLCRELVNFLTLWSYMDETMLTGEIPSEIGNLLNLEILVLGSNHLTGYIPTTIQYLNLDDPLSSRKSPHWESPSTMAKGYLTLQPFSWDRTTLLSYQIPFQMLQAPKSFVDSEQFIQWSPSWFHRNRKLVVVTSVDLSFNELSGGIPSTIDGLNNLINLSLAHNRLQGPIPDSVSKIVSLERLDLSHNNLTGIIPKTMGALQHLEYLNLSFNKLTGEIPSGGPFAHFNYQSFISNDALCGPPRFMVPACHSDHHHHHKLRQRVVLLVVLISLAILSAIFALTVCFFLIKRQRKTKLPSQLGLFPDVTLDRISYPDLERATNGFSQTNLLGIGSFGSVYKGVFTDETVVAVKVFNLQIEGSFKSFDTECEVLRNLRHRNLTKVISSCSNIDFRALILEYMPNGSLEKWLHSHYELLNLSQRLSIMIDVASAIDYLHHGYTTPVVHCDLKPSNVLLDNSMVAHVCDFGIAKLVNAEDTVVQTNTLATFGYIAPEYGSEGLVSTRCDVYSFGIMLMETFTRKRPTDDLFIGGLSLRDWINEAYPHSLSRLIDATLLDPEEKSFDKNVDCISRIMKLALDCTAELPTERTNMKDALASLQKIRNQFFSSRMTSSSS